MNDLLLWAVQNTIVALLLAILVFGITRVWHHPPTAHLLWLLVLIKLVAPPLVPIDWPLTTSDDGAAPSHVVVAPYDREKTLSEAAAVESTASSDQPDDATRPAGQEIVIADSASPALPVAPLASGKALHLAAQFATGWPHAQLAIIWMWLGDAAICGLVAILRIVRFERLLRDTLPASRRHEQLTAEIAARLGAGRVPAVRYAEFAGVPMLWCAGARPTIVLPRGLVAEISDDRLALILAHELAHLRRRDHWVRMIELIVVTIYWWNPVAWLIRRQIHQAEDLCCDAWVCWAFPHHAHRYAEAIFETADRLPGLKPGSRLIPASSFFHSTSLKARIEMILHRQFTPRLSRRSKWIVALFAVVSVPSAALTAHYDVGTASSADSSAVATAAGEVAPTSTRPGSDSSTKEILLAMANTSLEFPHAVPFEQGATRFADGDKITITEIRGTAENFAPGNIYWIKGTYTLASHDRATLAAYTTAREAKDGTSTSYKVQTTTVAKGSGTFSLYLPMNCRGWPHVSFYSMEDGNGFGGNYFGTGESTLKQWWGTKKSEPVATPPDAGVADAKAADEQPPKITVTRPRLQDVTLTASFLGRIHSHRHIRIRALEQGYLEAIKLREGQQVKRGDVLFTVIPILYQKKVEAERAEVKIAELEFNGAKKLAEDQVVSKEHLAMFAAKLQKAQAKADLARAELDFATVRAPFDGIIDRLQHQEGSLVEEGDTLTTLSDNTVMWVYFNVPESLYLEYVTDSKPQADDLKIELVLASGKKFNQSGKLGAIEADFSEETGSIPYRADFPNPDRILRHGQRGTIQISQVLNNALVIPQRATFEALAKRYVYVVDQDNVAHQREISYSNEVDDIFVIENGVGVDDKIILDGVRHVRDGEKVPYYGN
ncbi:MAG TPA: efflux RND transporter periplasmic adaptor subunit [Pirellulales bacterium]|nr:efflux RND transporter periplasmic adaptor subunit [Pirellulales bacterium]